MEEKIIKNYRANVDTERSDTLTIELPTFDGRYISYTQYNTFSANISISALKVEEAIAIRDAMNMFIGAKTQSGDK
jgi:hypothetical protein